MNTPTETTYVDRLFERAKVSIAAAEAKVEEAKLAAAEPPKPTFQENRTYRDPETGVRKRYVGGQFV